MFGLPVPLMPTRTDRGVPDSDDVAALSRIDVGPLLRSIHGANHGGSTELSSITRVCARCESRRIAL